MTTASKGSWFFDMLLRRRGLLLLFVVALTGILSAFAAKVRPDFSIEMAFPTFDKSRVDYERYKKDFPLDDAQAVVVVEAPDVFTEAGLRRIGALEDALGRIPGVVDTQGLTTVQDLTLDGESLRMGKLFPRPDLPAEELAKRRQIAVADPLFSWNLAPPDGRAAIIQVTLTRAQARTDEARTEFMLRARAVLKEHDQLAKQAGVSQRLVLNGLPIIRSEYTELINKDLGLLFPLAFLLVLVLLYVTFRKLSYIGAAVATILVSVIWTVGAMGIAHVPLQVLTQVTPIVVMIISISDTVHIVMHYRQGLRAGHSPHDALVEACHDSAIPCLLTEITIAGGFLGLIGNDMVMIQQFGVVTAIGMMLTWLANMTVLPLCLSLIRAQPDAGTAKASVAVTQFERFIAWVERAITSRPLRVLIAAGCISLVAGGLGTRAGKEYFSYDDLRPNNPLAQNIRYLESVHGGSVPFAIYIEPKDPAARKPDAMLEPEAVQLIDRITRKLESEFPEDVKSASSLSKYLRKAHRLLAGPEAVEKNGPLPRSRALTAQELLAIDDPRALRDVLSFERSTAVVLTTMPDRGSSHSTQVLDKLSRYFAEEEQKTPYRITLTGIYGIADGIYRSLVGGLVRSLGFAVLISFAIFCVVLRSLRLAAVALVPNLLPLLLTLGLMSLLRIDIKPTTVLIFSVTLVIADDDTIQYLSRFRRRFLSLPPDHPDPHRTAALETLRDTGLPMFTTSCAISLGFLVLLFSQFMGLANLGLLIGVSLLSAVFADLFLSPLLLMKLKPRLR